MSTEFLTGAIEAVISFLAEAQKRKLEPIRKAQAAVSLPGIET